MIFTGVRLDLEGGCDYAACAGFSFPLYHQLSAGKYDVCSVMEIPESLAEWRESHRTARKRADRAERRGYYAGPLAREQWEEDIHAINTSSPLRQGRPMSSSYLQPQVYPELPDYPCPRHATRITGVWSEHNDLVAYLVMHRAGELALVSQILGHAEHLEYEVMYLLFARALVREMIGGTGLCVYNRHDSGSEGLRFFKERLGFDPMEVEWAL